MKTTTHATHTPWWREPWPWLLMAGPFVALVACIVTIALALDGYARERIEDGGKKQGLVVSKPVVQDLTHIKKPTGD